jgi:predicted lactoylglutathione lyase
MLAGITLGTNQLQAAASFYNHVLSQIGMQQTMQIEGEVGFGINGESSFWILTPFNKNVATAGNGTQVTFKAKSNAQVDAFYNAAIHAGGQDEGGPGFRYREFYYGAYCRDLDGNKLHVMYEP